MLESFEGFRMTEVTGPREYTALDVAEEFSRIYHREVKLEVVSRAQWIQAFKEQGFSDRSARSYLTTAAVVVVPS